MTINKQSIEFWTEILGGALELYFALAEKRAQAEGRTEVTIEDFRAVRLDPHEDLNARMREIAESGKSEG